MSRKKSKLNRAEPPKKWQWTAARLLLALAVAIAGYLAWGSLTGATLPGCGPESACDKVLQSRWAYWFGVPVSIPALLVYVGLFASTFMAGRGNGGAVTVAVGLSMAVIGAVIWFVGLQVFVLGAYCRFCLAAHASAGIGAVLILSHFWRQLSTGGGAALIRPAFGRGLILAAGGVIILAVGQQFKRPEGYQVGTVSTHAPAPTAAGPSEPAPVARIHSLHGGQFNLPVHELPLIGTADAPYVIVSLFDYTCHHCRDMHKLLVQAQKESKDQLAIISLPMPLDGTCNSLVKRTPPAHVNACEYARLGLAVWRANPDAFQSFDDWIFAPETPPSVLETRQHAEQLIGKEALERALADEWINKQLQIDIGIYQANYRETRDGRMPQLIVGKSIVSGPVYQIQNLYRLLAENLGLKLPSGS